MPWFRDLSISKKFLYTFAANCILCALLGGTAIFGLVKVNSAINRVVLDSMPSMKALGNIRYDLATVRRTDTLLLVCDTDWCTAHYEQKRAAALTEFKGEIARYGGLVNLPGEQQLSDSIKESAAAYIEASEDGNRYVQSGQRNQAVRVLMEKRNLDVYNALIDAVQKDIDLNERAGADQGQRAVQSGRMLLTVICILMAIAVALCAIIGTILTRMIAPPLRAATTALEQLADKDLTASVEEGGKDEIGRLSAALNRSVGSMRSVLETITRSADTLATAAGGLSERSTEGSDIAQSQSSKTSQIAAAAHEMTATIGEISQNAESAADASRKSAEAARLGGAVMQAASAIMERIGSATASVAERMHSLSLRSQEIGRVVTVIQEISEQTNLLALNAAIEAARAGEHGRGFAVVAGEVRRLAERTKRATEEIAATIGSIQAETSSTADVMENGRVDVETGVQETTRAHASLEAIITATKDVEQMINLIATAAQEQTSASAEISESANQISQLATKNSTYASEAVVACRNLSSLSAELERVTRQFRLDNGQNQRPKPSRRPEAWAARAAEQMV
ncbi:MAG TPA: methyl-accepting chemotaxis protein [Terracidiphilus sp.]|nr:methyl-accepting chemotaxis protein [Terracidiphilus sp.]